MGNGVAVMFVLGGVLSLFGAGCFWFSRRYKQALSDINQQVSPESVTDCMKILK